MSDGLQTCYEQLQHSLPPLPSPSLSLPDGEDYPFVNTFAIFQAGMTSTDVGIQTSEDEVAETVESFTLQIVIPERLTVLGVVFGSINETTVEIKDDDSECFAAAGNQLVLAALQQQSVVAVDTVVHHRSPLSSRPSPLPALTQLTN